MFDALWGSGIGRRIATELAYVSPWAGLGEQEPGDRSPLRPVGTVGGSWCWVPTGSGRGQASLLTGASLAVAALASESESAVG
jgi:hypothetical protein